MTDTSDTNFFGGSSKKTGFIHRIAGKSQSRHEYNSVNIIPAAEMGNNDVKQKPFAMSFSKTAENNIDNMSKYMRGTDIGLRNEPDGDKTNVSDTGNDLDIQITMKKMLEVASNMMCVVKNDIIFMLNKAAGPLLEIDDVNNYCGRSFSGLITEKDRRVFKDVSSIVDGRRDILTKIIKDNGAETDCIIRVGYLKRDDTSLYAIEIRRVEDNERLKDIKAMNDAILYDNLTGASSDFLFIDRLKHSIAKDTNSAYRKPVYPVKLTVMAANVSDLHDICRVYGSDAADFAMKIMIDRINDKCEHRASVCRCGYDNIFLAFDDIENIEDAELTAKTLLDVINEPIIYEYNKLAVKGYMGIAVYPLHHLKADDLIASAKKCSSDIKGSDKFIKVYEIDFK